MIKINEFLHETINVVNKFLKLSFITRVIISYNAVWNEYLKKICMNMEIQ